MSEFTIRHYSPPTDLPRLSRMLTEVESIDRDGEDTSEESLLASLEWPNYRPDQDIWVAESNGELVGYGVALEQPSQRSTLYVVVHPSQRRKGLGSQLLDLTLARARELGSEVLLIYANEHNSASNLFLQQKGFVSIGSAGTMIASSTVQTPPFEFPAGFALKKYSEVRDPVILLTALDNCYQDMWGHQHSENRPEEERQSPRLLKYREDEDILLLFDSRGVVSGICSLKSEAKQEQNDSRADLLDAPGVIKKYRQEGYQRQLVLAGIQRLREKGTRAIVLEFWGDSEHALNIYRALGFEMLKHYITYHKKIVKL